MNRIPREDLKDILEIVRSHKFRAIIRWLKHNYNSRVDELLSIDEYEQQLIKIGECRMLKEFITEIKNLRD